MTFEKIGLDVLEQPVRDSSSLTLDLELAGENCVADSLDFRRDAVADFSDLLDPLSDPVAHALLLCRPHEHPYGVHRRDATRAPEYEPAPSGHGDSLDA